MDKEHLFYRAEYDMGTGTAVHYRINGEMSREERDLIQEALSLYKTKLQEESCFCKQLYEKKTFILDTLDKLINKFDTMVWEEQ